MQFFRPSIICSIVLLLLNSITTSATEKVTPSQIEAWTKAGLAAYARDDLITSMGYLDRAAKHNNAKAQAMLGYIYHQSDEVEMAVPLFEQAAAQGNTMAIFQLSSFYDQGRGVTKDAKKSMALLQQAADANHLPAWYALAAAYERGTAPLQVNYEMALKYYQMAADKHHLASTIRIIHSYERGELGLDVDLKHAKLLRGKANAYSNKEKSKQ